MSSEKQNSAFSKIMIPVVIALLIGSSSPWWWADVKNFFDPPLPPSVIPLTPPSKCSLPWEWDANLEECVKKVTIPSKTFSIPLTDNISQIDGRIDFYTNRNRLPGTNNKGQAKYDKNVGGVQVVIPIMKGTTNVGSAFEVIYSTNEGRILKISSLPETTGHLKRMQVAYSLLLDTDCNRAESFCKAKLVASGNRVSITTKELMVTIVKNNR